MHQWDWQLWLPGKDTGIIVHQGPDSGQSCSFITPQGSSGSPIEQVG
nr:hypothetical protein [Methanobacterium formicicum]